MNRIRFGVLLIAGCAALTSATLPNPVVDADRGTAKGKQTAVFAGGCFWCTEGVFEHVIGVEKVMPGYAGGDSATAHYEMVGSGRTKHAESIEVTYDPKQVTYGQLLKVFFGAAHDPTQKDRQGPDWGTQYRSAIFYNDAEQKKVAEAYIRQLDESHAFGKPIATVVSALPAFYPAEEYHRRYVQRHPDDPYVVQNFYAKLEKLKKYFPELYKK